MKVALAVPEPSANVVINAPPLNLGYLASYLRAYGRDVEVKIFDGVVQKNVYSEIIKFQPEVVGISATTPLAYDAYSLSDRLRGRLEDTITVLGGVHPSAVPHEAMQYADSVIVGEGERALLDIVNSYPNKPKKRIEGSPIMNLDEIPSPAFDLLDVESYLRARDNPGFYYPYGLDYVRTGTVITSRGCHFRCVFCRNSNRREPVRYHSAERVVDEVKLFLERYNVNSMFFLDDEFAINFKRLKRIGELFKEHGISIPWGCQARTPTLTYERMKYMKNIGCRFVSVGFEHGNERMLKFLKKGSATVAQNNKALIEAERAEMKIGGSFIYGSPTETKKEMEDTIKFILEHPQFVFVGINVLVPYPGTEVFSICQKMGLLPEKVDYRKLIPTSKAEDTYTVCDTVNPEYFRRLVTDAQRRTWVIARTHLLKQTKKYPIFKWLKHFRLAVWNWMLFNHPKNMLQLFREVTVESLRSK
ncbi:MAG: radical SAM protein [Candidatus Bathyarchaeota archaeon]|jgi:radical SAM superfamily enzyme YgiQ (UPF0313 family)